MKTLTCKELGGVCDDKLSSNSQNDMANKAMNHMREKHPEILDGMSAEDRAMWTESLQKKWNSIPVM